MDTFQRKRIFLDVDNSTVKIDGENLTYPFSKSAMIALRKMGTGLTHDVGFNYNGTVRSKYGKAIYVNNALVVAGQKS